MAIDLKKLQQKFDALLEDPKSITDFEEWLKSRCKHEWKIIDTITFYIVNYVEKKK